MTILSLSEFENSPYTRHTAPLRRITLKCMPEIHSTLELRHKEPGTETLKFRLMEKVLGFIAIQVSFAECSMRLHT